MKIDNKRKIAGYIVIPLLAINRTTAKKEV
jgi:hypothetical protein